MSEPTGPTITFIPPEGGLAKVKSSGYMADQFYVFEATITEGDFYEDIGAKVIAAAKEAGDAKRIDGVTALVPYVGTIQKAGLDWDGHLQNLWLVFKDSSNTDAGSYAIVMDLDQRIDILPEEVMGLFKKIADVEFAIRVKRIIYSHNLDPNLLGSSRQAILGKDGDDQLQPVLNWPENFKAGIIYEFELELGTIIVPFIHPVAVPAGMKYDKNGNIVKDPDHKTPKDYVEGVAKHFKTQIDDRLKNETGLSEKEKAKLNRKKNSLKDYKRTSDKISKISKLQFKHFGIDHFAVTNKGLSLNISISAYLEVGPLKAKAIDFQLVFDMVEIKISDWLITGLGFHFKKPPTFSVEGAVLVNPDFASKVKVPGKPDTLKGITSFSGGLAIGLTNWSILVLAAYDKVKENEREFTSLFIFGFLGGKLSPPIFGVVTLTGIAITLGLNRSLLFPTDMGELPSHPLIAAASTVPSPDSKKEYQKEKAADDEKPKGEKDPYLEDPDKGMQDGLVGMLKSLKTYVPPKNGSFFAGLGLRANIVELVDVFIMPVVTVEMDVEKEMPNISGIKLQLFGVASMALPKGAPDGIAPLELQLAFGAEVEIPSGRILVGGTLSGSLIRLSPFIQLDITGGMAFLRQPATRYKDATFILTVGGYGTIVTPEPGWPLVDPVGISFNPISEIEISAGFYFFFSPKYIGIGFDINGRASLGISRVSATASFSIGLNALLQLDPFMIKAEAHANFHLALTVNYLLSSSSASMDIQAKLVSWYGTGVQFSGKGELHINLLFSFNLPISWGEGSERATPLDWVDYVTAFVPHHKEEEPEEEKGKETRFMLRVSSARLIKGMIGNVKKDGNDIPILHPDELELEASGHFPSVKMTFNGLTIEDKPDANPESVGIQMMGLTQKNYEENMAPELEVVLSHEVGGQDFPLTSQEISSINYEMIYSDVPASQWKPANEENLVPAVDPHGPDMVKGVRKGVNIKVKAPKLGRGHKIPKSNLSFDVTAADVLELQSPQRVEMGAKLTEQAVTESMATNPPNSDILAALGISGVAVFNQLKDIDLQAVPYLA